MLSVALSRFRVPPYRGLSDLILDENRAAKIATHGIQIWLTAKTLWLVVVSRSAGGVLHIPVNGVEHYSRVTTPRMTEARFESVQLRGELYPRHARAQIRDPWHDQEVKANSIAAVCGARLPSLGSARKLQPAFSRLFAAMKSSTVALTWLLSTATGVFGKVNYDGAQAVRIPVGEDVTPLVSLIEDLNLSVWKGAPKGVPLPNTHVDLVVPADKVAEFNDRTVDINTEIMHEDLGASIAAEGVSASYRIGSANLTWFNAYHAYADHLQFLRDVVATYPANSKIVTVGASVQGRQITGIHFYGTGGGGNRPAIVLHGTVHAREWITGMTTEYLAFNLLSKYATDAEIRGFVDKYDFYIFPIVNPDGFVYTQTTNRLWRKNRQTVGTSSCIGRDINRNWPYKWDTPGGSSTDPCSETYRGLAQGDAPENAILSGFLNRIQAAQGVQLYIDVHSYSQLFMTPYGYSCTALPPNNNVLQSLARGVGAAITAVYGTRYRTGPSCTTIYPATGVSIDYVNDVTKAKYTFTIELRDTGTNGFILPASQIVPTGVETYAGFRYLLLNMA